MVSPVPHRGQSLPKWDVRPYIPPAALFAITTDMMASRLLSRLHQARINLNSAGRRRVCAQSVMTFAFGSLDGQSWPKSETQLAIFWSYFKNLQLHFGHRISASDRLLCSWNVKSGAALQQHYSAVASASIASDRSRSDGDGEMR